MSKGKSHRSALSEDQLRADALDLANQLMAGRGMEALDVIYGGAYSYPSALASLLRYTAGVVQFRANQHPRESA